MRISEESWSQWIGEVPVLEADQIHLWRADLADRLRHVTAFAATLSDDERIRAGRFKFDRDRDLYVLSRGVLRALLSAYTGLDARALSFSYGPQGKPSLDPAAGIEFNLSHSGGMCALAFARSSRVGVDIERKARNVSFLELAERFFAPAERDELAAMNPDEVREAFYAVWTRKEAYIKALGEGVTHGLDNFSVTVEADVVEPSVHSDRDPNAHLEWRMVSFAPRSGFAGALAFENRTSLVVPLEYVPRDP